MLESLVLGRLEGRTTPEAWGDQVLVDARTSPLEIEERLLIGASDLSAEETVREIRALDGLVIASHVDRPAFSLAQQLGFVPPELPLDARGALLSPLRRPGPVPGLRLSRWCASPTRTSPRTSAARRTAFRDREAGGRPILRGALARRRGGV